MNAHLSDEVASLLAASYAGAMGGRDDVPMQDILAMAQFSAQVSGAGDLLAAEAAAKVARRAADVVLAVRAMAAEIVASVSEVPPEAKAADVEDVADRLAAFVAAETNSWDKHTSGSQPTRVADRTIELAIILRGLQAAARDQADDTGTDVGSGDVVSHVAMTAARVHDRFLLASSNLVAAAANGPHRSGGSRPPVSDD